MISSASHITVEEAALLQVIEALWRPHNSTSVRFRSGLWLGRDQSDGLTLGSMMVWYRLGGWRFPGSFHWTLMCHVWFPDTSTLVSGHRCTNAAVFFLLAASKQAIQYPWLAAPGVLLKQQVGFEKYCNLLNELIESRENENDFLDPHKDTAHSFRLWTLQHWLTNVNIPVWLVNTEQIPAWFYGGAY